MHIWLLPAQWPINPLYHLLPFQEGPETVGKLWPSENVLLVAISLAKGIEKDWAPVFVIRAHACGKATRHPFCSLSGVRYIFLALTPFKFIVMAIATLWCTVRGYEDGRAGLITYFQLLVLGDNTTCDTDFAGITGLGKCQPKTVEDEGISSSLPVAGGLNRGSLKGSQVNSGWARLCLSAFQALCVGPLCRRSNIKWSCGPLCNTKCFCGAERRIVKLRGAQLFKRFVSVYFI